MNKKILMVIIITALLTAGAVGIVLSREQTWMPRPPPNFDPNLPPENFIPQDRDQYLGIKTAMTMINMTLSVILMALYVKIYRDTKSEFTVGLIIMTFSLFLYATLSNPLLPLLFGYRMMGLGLFSILPDIFTTVALSVLLYLGLK
jgi:hypothetical protein